jgi:hypothetical protein
MNSRLQMKQKSPASASPVKIPTRKMNSRLQMKQKSPASASPVKIPTREMNSNLQMKEKITRLGVVSKITLRTQLITYCQ